MEAKRKVQVPLEGEDGNVFSIIARVSAALRRDRQREAAAEYTTRCFAAKSYDEVLQITLEYAE